MTPGYDKEHQIAVLAHMVRDPQIMNLAISLKAQPDDFDLPACSFVWEVVRNYYTRHRRLLGSDVVSMEVDAGLANVYGDMTVALMDAEKESLFHVLSTIYTCGLNPDYFQHQIGIFLQGVRMQRLAARMADPTLTIPEKKQMCGEMARLGDMDTLAQSALGFFSEDPGLLTLDSMEERIPTGLRLFDTRIDGGLGRGELGQVTACQGVGKTNAMLNFAMGALEAGFFPLYITLEQPRREINRRFAAMRAGIPAMWIKKPVELWPPEMQHRLRTAMQDTERIMFAVADLTTGMDKTLETVEKEIVGWQSRMASAGYSRGAWLVLVDYLDELLPPRDRRLGKNARTDEFMTSTAKEMSRIVRRLNVACWTCTQGTREAVSKTHLGMQDTSGAFHKNDPLVIGVGIGRERNSCVASAVLPGEYEEYTDANALEGEELIFNINKSRSSILGPFRIWRGKTLKYWDHKNDAEFEQHMLEKLPGHPVVDYHILVSRTPQAEKDARIDQYRKAYAI